MSNLVNPYDPVEAHAISVTSPRTNWTSRIVTTAVFLMIGLVFLGLLLPATRRSRPASERMMCSSNLRQLAIALLNYEHAFGQLPPAYTVNEQGKPMHSWRTLVLPYLEQNALYSKIDLEKPWDDPINEEARKTYPGVFRCPASKTKKGFTTYQAIVSDQSCFRPTEGRMLTEITDGTSNTILLAESDLESAVHWMSPHDMDLEEFLSQKVQSKTAHFGGRHAVMADVAVKFLPQEFDKDDLRAMVTVAGGEAVASPY